MPGAIILALLAFTASSSGFTAIAFVGSLACLIAYARHRDRDHKERARELAQIQMAQSTEINRYHVMGPREFEEAIAYLCHRDGCTNAQRTGKAGDLGADVMATTPDGRRIVIQCKRYGPTTAVGSGDLQRFGGTCYAVHGAHVAAVVTTSRFTRPASNYAQTMGIRTFDQNALAAWASRTGPAPWMT
ncbi:restriction endonuclease [Streptomyces phaeochromogenes]